MVRLCGFGSYRGIAFRNGSPSSPAEAQVALFSIFHAPRLQVLFLGIYLLICQLSINIDGADRPCKEKKATLTLRRHLHEKLKPKPNPLFVKSEEGLVQPEVGHVTLDICGKLLAMCSALLTCNESRKFTVN